MATAKKAPAKKAKAADDELLSGKADDVLAGKAKKTKVDDVLAGKKKAPVKKKKAAPVEDGPTAEDVRKVLLKTRKATSYSDIATENGFNLRMVRRQSRALAATGEVEITKEATLGYVKALKKAA